MGRRPPVGRAPVGAAGSSADPGSRRGPDGDPGSRRGPDGDPGSRRGPDGDPLLVAKFTVPALPGIFVPRERLQDMLSTGTAGPLTLITGPAGAGKTTLAASWATLATPPGPVVWLTVEGPDRAPGTFWTYVIEAFRRRVPLPDEVAVPTQPDTVDPSLLIRLAAALSGLEHPVVLVLDGLDRLPDREVASGLDFVLGHTERRLRLVLTSRVDPLLPLHRYRAEDRVREIRGSDLAFTRQEAATLLKGHGLALRDDSVGALSLRTEGWAAGLRLCALAVGQAGDPDGFARSLAASESAVAEYLFYEVLEAQPDGTRDLLLRTAVLERIHPQLADALTGRQDADWILARLTRDNAFLERIGDTAWYRCHPLFAEVLRAHLRHDLPGLEPQLRRAAADWFEKSGRLLEAAEQATAAGAWHQAAGLVVDHFAIGRLLTGPDTQRFERLFIDMPADQPGTAPALVAAALALARHDTEACRTHLGRAEDQLAAAARAGAQAEPPAAVRLARSLLRLFAGPDPDAAAHEISELLEQAPPDLLTEHTEIEALWRYGLGRTLLRSGRLGEALGALTHAVRSCAADTTADLRHRCLSELAFTESLLGALRQAERHALQALAVAEDGGIPRGRRSAYSSLALAAVASERGEPDAAGHHLRTAAESADAEHDPVCATESAVIRSRLCLASGSWQAALAALNGGPPPDGAAAAAWPAERVAIARAAVHVARGAPRAAIGVLEAAPPGGPAHTLALAEAHLAGGDADRAARLLAPLARQGGGEDRGGVAAQVRIRLLRAGIAALAGDTATADRLLGQALSTAHPEGMRRPFTESGPRIRRLLGHRTEAADAPPRPAPGEQLTHREVEVLRCVAEMMSTEEIASELHVSANTVKTHLSSIYRKLAVSRRSEAVRRARELGVL
ncbi:LuxR C-terminal-related transcriptional regulator [Streptomyces sp. NPDC000410]|uniref:LuxR C-terminal-related transcriptional regulator n=1 Tax=Streptomyces sp. NPDC000410 TaxID=3154254 RepID=UPI003322DD5B